MKKILTAVFCTALALTTSLTAYADEMPTQDEVTEIIWEDWWHGKDDDGLVFPEASYKRHLIENWVDEYYRTDKCNWTSKNSIISAYERYYRDMIEDWAFNDDENGNWTIETEDNLYSFYLEDGMWQMVDKDGNIVDTFPPFDSRDEEELEAESEPAVISEAEVTTTTGEWVSAQKGDGSNLATAGGEGTTGVVATAPPAIQNQPTKAGNDLANDEEDEDDEDESGLSTPAAFALGAVSVAAVGGLGVFIVRKKSK